MAQTHNEVQLRDFTITRTIHAPQERVFQAWTDPELLSQWFAPKSWSAPRDKIAVDLRPDGSFGVTMVDLAGDEYPALFYYRDVVASHRLVFTTGAPDMSPNDPDIAVASVELRRAGDQTEMTFSGQVPIPEAEDVKAGWKEMFDRLDETLAEGQ